MSIFAMRDVIFRSLKTAIDSTIVEDLIQNYEKLITEYRKGDSESALNACGKFVEHVLRAIEYIRSGSKVSEIKSVAGSIKDIEKDGNLPEELRILMPRVASALMFDMRSKRGAAHVKEIDPRNIDAALAAQAASWIMSEFIRLYHVGGEREVAEAMASLMRGNVPLIEKFDEEFVVTVPLSSEVEVLLHLFVAEPTGLDRKGLGVAVKHPAPNITKAIDRLGRARFVHKMKSGVFRITGPGERHLAEKLAGLQTAATAIPTRR